MHACMHACKRACVCGLERKREDTFLRWICWFFCQHFVEGRPTDEYPYPLPYDGRPVQRGRKPKTWEISEICYSLNDFVNLHNNAKGTDHHNLAFSVSVCAWARTYITWKHYCPACSKILCKKGNRLDTHSMQPNNVEPYTAAATTTDSSGPGHLLLHQVLPGIGFSTGGKDCLYVSQQSHRLILKMRQGIPIAERGQLSHHWFWKSWSGKILSMQTSHLVYTTKSQNGAPVTSNRPWTWHCNSISHAPCPIQLYHKFQWGKIW